MITFIICQENVNFIQEKTINLTEITSINNDIKTPYFMFVNGDENVKFDQVVLLNDFLPDLLILSPNIGKRTVLNKFRRHNQEIVAKEQHLFNKIIKTSFFTKSKYSNLVDPFTINLMISMVALKVVVEPFKTMSQIHGSSKYVNIPACVEQLKTGIDTNIFYSDFLRDELNILKAEANKTGDMKIYLAIEKLLRTREL